MIISTEKLLQDKFSLAIYNRFRTGQLIVAEGISLIDGCRRWIAIHYDLHMRLDSKQYKWVIMDVHVLSTVDIKRYVQNEEVIDRKYYGADTEKEIYEVLKVINISPDLFTYPWKLEYPF